MEHSDYKYLEFFTILLCLTWLWYLFKLYYTDHIFSIYLFDAIISLYCMMMVVLLVVMKKKLLCKKYGYSTVKYANKPNGLIEKLKAMHPKDFEDFIKLLFELRWYKVVYKSFWKRYFSSRIPQKDWWIDLIAIRDNKKIYVQIKKNITNMVSVDMIRSFYGSIVHRLTWEDKWLFVTTSVFSEDAEKCAKENHIEMISYKELEKEIVWLEKEIQKRQRIEDFLSKIDYYQNKKYNQNIRTCPKCGAPLKWRKEWFYGCQNYYKTGCDYTEK